MIELTTYVLPPLISSLLFLGLGFLVFSKNKKSSIHRSFLFLCLATFWWQFNWFILFGTGDRGLAEVLIKIGYIGIIFIPITSYHFFLLLLDSTKKTDKLILYASYLIGAAFTLILLFTNWLIDGYYKYYFGFYPRASFLHPVYLIFLASLALRILYLTVYNLKTSRITSVYKYNQLKYVVWAVIFYIFASADFMINYGIEFYPPGYLFILIFLGIFAYTIVRHRLMDIKMVMRRYSVFLVSLSVVLALATVVKYIFDSWFYNYASWGDPLILVAALFIFPPIRNYFYRLANKYFFSSLYDSSEVIASLSDKLRSTLETEKIYDFIYQTLTNAFHVKAFGLLIYNEADKNYMAQYNDGFVLNKQKIFPEDKTLTEMFIKNNQPIITEDASRIVVLNGNKTIEVLKRLGVAILTPLNVKDKTIGLIALGKKESGDMYNDEDLKVLEVVGAQTAIALENALLYKETKNFSIKLEKEVEKATHDLKKANIQLKKLDAAKSEFISIASHQLRTPLTVIKGYISMMLEGNFGALTKPETESLEKVFLSNERLIQLVENLLNISRIESGRLQFDFQMVDLNKMIESVMEELAGNAKKKNLILQYKPSAKLLPKIKIDDEKIRQVVMNLIDNAIKYTKQGSVTVKLEQRENKIKFSVADSGMGIRPEDMVNLFKKFSRGTGTSLIHTEGTGLGLYVARMMIEAHHGKIWAESNGEGKGSKFCFELPIK